MKNNTRATFHRIIFAILLLSFVFMAGCKNADDPYEDDRKAGTVNLFNKATMFLANDFKGQFDSVVVKGGGLTL